MSSSLVNIDDPEGISDADLDRALAVLDAERRRRSLDAADPDALVEWGFANLFKSDGTPLDPQVRSGLLVCPGARWGRSPLSHKCSFVRVDGEWVWESPYRVADEMRSRPQGQQFLQTVTVLSPPAGAPVDSLACQARNAVHELKAVRSFVVEADGLQWVSARTVRAADHR